MKQQPPIGGLIFGIIFSGAMLIAGLSFFSFAKSDGFGPPATFINFFAIAWCSVPALIFISCIVSLIKRATGSDEDRMSQYEVTTQRHESPISKMKFRDRENNDNYHDEPDVDSFSSETSDRKYDGPFCPFCGKPVEDEFNFCPGCGKDI